MRVGLFIVLAFLMGLRVSASQADPFCSAPLSDWQPPETLQASLEADGWRGVTIRVEDGCYLVHAFNDRGERLRGKFDPATLAPLPGRHGRHGEGWTHDRPED